MSRAFIPRMGGAPAHMSRDPDAVQRLNLETLRLEFGVDTSPAAGLTGEALRAWVDAADDAVFEREHAELRAQRSQYRTRPADDGGFYFLSGDAPSAGVRHEP